MPSLASGATRQDRVRRGAVGPGGSLAAVRGDTVGAMQSEPSWVMLAVAVLLVAGLTALVAWLAVTEARAVRAVPAGRRRPGTSQGRGPGAGGLETRAE